MTELLLVKVKSWGLKTKCFWPAIVVHPSDVPQHIKIKAKGRQVVKFFNSKLSDQYGIAPFKETESFYINVEPNDFSCKPKLQKAFEDALEYADAYDVCKSKLDVLPEILFIDIFVYIDWRSRLKLESVSKKWRRILLDRRLGDIGRIDLTDFRYHSKLPQMVRSLVVDKDKLVREIICSSLISTDVLTMVMNTITNAPRSLEKLICLELVMSFRNDSECCSFNSLLNLCIHLNMLKLHNDLTEVTHSTPHRFAELDLSELVHLTELSGNNILYRNLRAPHLSILEYCDLDLRRTGSLDGCDEFRNTMDAISANIEVLILRSVLLSRSSNDSSRTITMPNLTKLVLERDNLAGIAVDLECSTKLRHLVVRANCQIINFDLSLLHLDYFDTYTFNGVFFNQFLASATNHPTCLSLLEGLRIGEPAEHPDRLSRFLGCISPCYTYSLRSFTVDGVQCVPGMFSDVNSTGLATLIDHSPHLKDINFSFDAADVADLNAFIVDVVCLDRDVCVCIHVRYPFMDSLPSTVLSILYKQLTIGVDLSVVKCRCRIRVEYRKPTPSRMYLAHLLKMKKQFRVFLDPY